MTPIDYLLLTGTVLAAGYVVARLFVGWLRSPANHPGVERDEELNGHAVPERQLEPIENTGAPWRSRK